MANNPNGVSLLQPAIPIFQGSNYEVWSIKMKTLFISQDLWDLVERGYPIEGVIANALRDAKALFFIQYVVDDAISPRISTETKSKEAWDALKNGYQGTEQVLIVKLHILLRRFESFFMKDGGSLDGYFNNLLEAVNQMKKYGE